MKKSVLSFIIVMTVLLPWAENVHAVPRVAKVNGWELYYTASNESAIITGTGSKGTNPYTIIIPDEIDGYKVTYIEENALRKTELAKLVLPDGIEHLDVKMPEELSSITFPSKLKTIGDSVFKYTQIKEIRIPKTVTSIGRSAFESCEKLTKAVLPENLEFLGPDAFRGCTNLEEINIPDGIKWSVDDSFDGCRKIRKVNYNGEMTANMEYALKNTRFMRDLNIERVYDDDDDTSSYVYDDVSHVIAVTNDNGNIQISVNGRNVFFTDAAPFIDENSRTQAPLRRIAARTGCRVHYDAETLEITITKLNLNVRLRIGSNDMTVNGETIAMDTEAIIVNDRTFIPIRYLARALGYEITYN